MRSSQRCRTGFTLVELLVAVAVFALLLGIIAAATQATSLTVRRASSKLSTYATARAAFNTLNEKLAQATLNTYMDYYDSAGNLCTQATAASFIPATYGRVSNLQFLVQQNSASGCGQEIYFQCPDAYSHDASYQSTRGLLNACGYYVQYGNNADFRPSLIAASKWRYRLMQAIEPTEQLQVYANGSANIDKAKTWTGNIADTGSGQSPATDALPLADNVIALVIWPRLPTGQDAAGTQLAPNYLYDSQLSPGKFSGTPATQPLWADQLPPIVQVTMVVIDEASAIRLDTKSSTPPPLINNALQGKFSDVNKYSADLAALESSLAANHIGFETLNTSVVMGESKWSQ